jgi:hypothetical protein
MGVVAQRVYALSHGVDLGAVLAVCLDRADVAAVVDVVERSADGGVGDVRRGRVDLGVAGRPRAGVAFTGQRLPLSPDAVAIQ